VQVQEETAARPRIRQGELTALLAMSMALSALGIDLMLPAFGAIRADLGLAEGATAVTGLVTAYFLGLGAGTLVYGPLADRFGRKPILFLGFAVYGVGALAATLAPTLGLLFAARFVWGLGAAGPRVITLAVIRDIFEGERMSQAMSFVMAVFILVPIFAPGVGAVVSDVTSWRWLFAGCVVAAAAVAVWATRLPETLHPEHRLPFRPGRIARAVRLVVTTRATMAYTLAQTFLYGAFTSYLASSEAIIGITFDAEGAFPVVFGGLAAVMGGAMLLNARIVHRAGTRRLASWVLRGYLGVAAAMAVIAAATGGRPPLWVFLLTMAAMLTGHALLIPNLNTLAMAPMAAIAGTASSVIGAMQIVAGATLGALLDRAFDGTIRPLSFGFLGYGLAAAALVRLAPREPAAGATMQPDAAHPDSVQPDTEIVILEHE
jgi:MFS transporter, DHA1 family, multidrug resistance protein